MQKPGYLHGTVTGQNSRENVAAYLRQGLQECLERGSTHILIEARLQGARLPLWDIFEIAAEHSKLDMGIFRSIAYVDTRAPAALLTFIQHVTGNRGLPLRVFNSVAAAEQWLAARIDEDSQAPCAVD
ncbi:MAG: hypothetical protein HZC22_16360 [Rhodocyclales bacterium]|nr:hypothetical protein [Rhodocyclales bacterium]